MSVNFFYSSNSNYYILIMTTNVLNFQPHFKNISKNKCYILSKQHFDFFYYVSFKEKKNKLYNKKKLDYFYKLNCNLKFCFHYTENLVLCCAWYDHTHLSIFLFFLSIKWRSYHTFMSSVLKKKKFCKEPFVLDCIKPAFCKKSKRPPISFQIILTFLFLELQ